MTITEILFRLATDAEFRKEFNAGPEAFANKYELEPKDRELLLTGTPNELRLEIRLATEGQGGTEGECGTGGHAWVFSLPWLH